MDKHDKKRVKYPISLKLISIISILVILTLGAVTTLVTMVIRSDVQLTAEQNNHTINTQAADAAEKELSSVRSNALLLMSTFSAIGSQRSLAQQYSELFFERNQNIAVIAVPGNRELLNNRFFLSNEIDVETYYTFLDTIEDSLTRSGNGETLIVNAAPVFGIPVLALLYPWAETSASDSLIVLFSAETLTETFGSGSTNSSFMINDKNDVLIHADFELTKSGANMSNVPLVTQMRTNNDENRQIVFEDEQGIEYFGAYTKLSIGDVGVITMIESRLVFEAVNASVYQNILLALAVLFLAIMFIWFFSKSLSKPIKLLASASEQIERGDFILKLENKSQDELGVLTDRFVSMGKGLENFGKFVNREIALKAMSGDLPLGGETKDATIFFSDIRSFTAISEKLEPHEVIEFLNDYMTRMVKCVNDTNGTVDKFIGDAVMAVWGAAKTAGSREADALNGVKASLLMRAALADFNQGRGGDKKPIIKIGCGLNTGPVVAGQMGSSELKMEYTVIGDAVNFASRTETLTKPFGADILITEDTYELVKEHVIVEKMPSVTVKGKEKPVKIYAVVNMPNVTDVPGAGANGPKSMAEVRAALGIPTPDFAKVNADAEEKKYNIGN